MKIVKSIKIDLSYFLCSNKIQQEKHKHKTNFQNTCEYILSKLSKSKYRLIYIFI